MVFKTIGNKSNPVILFFHAMGVIGESSMPVAEKMQWKYYCIMPIVKINFNIHIIIFDKLIKEW